MRTATGQNLADQLSASALSQIAEWCEFSETHLREMLKSMEIGTADWRALTDDRDDFRQLAVYARQVQGYVRPTKLANLAQGVE